jgi:hypothetical protein
VRRVRHELQIAGFGRNQQLGFAEIPEPLVEPAFAMRVGELLETGSDATFLREMIGFAAERLMALETETLRGAGPGERNGGRPNQRNGYRDRGWWTTGRHDELRIPVMVGEAWLALGRW